MKRNRSSEAPSVPFPRESTPFPNILLDDLMPRLRDTEWRLLCVVVRQTLGWKRGKGRKQADWLTQRQLMKKTGRASEAVSKAIDHLVREGLLQVRAGDGTPLPSAAERRRHSGQVYYGLGIHTQQ